MTKTRARWLRATPYFNKCSAELVAAVAALCRSEIYIAGDVICREGEIGTQMFVCRAGRVVVTTAEDVLKAKSTSGGSDGRSNGSDSGKNDENSDGRVCVMLDTGQIMGDIGFFLQLRR
jgi:CRP-like cAMP-binding protein